MKGISVCFRDQIEIDPYGLCASVVCSDTVTASVSFHTLWMTPSGIAEKKKHPNAARFLSGLLEFGKNSADASHREALKKLVPLGPLDAHHDGQVP